MNEIVLIVGLLVGQCTVTSYQSIKSQTDSSPHFTSTGVRTHHGGVAISRDLLCPICRTLHRRCGHHNYLNKLHYDEYIFIEKLGFYSINDVMGESIYDRTRHKRVPIHNHFDIWVGSLDEERAIKTQMQKVYVVKRTIK